MSSGRVFQTRGPATVKARLPTVESPSPVHYWPLLFRGVAYIGIYTPKSVYLNFVVVLSPCKD